MSYPASRAIALFSLVLAPSLACGGVTGDVAELRNFSANAVSMLVEGEVPGPANQVAPNGGKRNVSVGNTIGDRTTFVVVSDGMTVATKSCTVTTLAWISVPPTVALQPSGAVDCIDW